MNYTLTLQNPAVPSQKHVLPFKDVHNAMCAFVSMEQYLRLYGLMNRQMPLMYVDTGTRRVTRINNGHWVECAELRDGRIVPTTGPQHSANYFSGEEDLVPMAMKIEPILPEWVYMWSFGVGL